MEASKAEQRSDVRLLTAEGVRGCDIYRRLERIYGDYILYITGKSSGVEQAVLARTHVDRG